MEGIRRVLSLCLVLITGTAIEQDPSVGPPAPRSSLTLLKKECNEMEVQPYRKTDYKLMLYVYSSLKMIGTLHVISN